MRKGANILPYMTLHSIPLSFLIYEENFIIFFISVLYHTKLKPKKLFENFFKNSDFFYFLKTYTKSASSTEYIQLKHVKTS